MPNPTLMPSICGIVRRNPNVAPDAVSMTLLGPGVIDITKEYVAKGRGSTMALSRSTPDLECKSRCLRQPKAGTEGGRAPSTVLARDRYAGNLYAVNWQAFR